MQILTFDKKFLLEKLAENRTRHKDIFNESLIAYRQAILDKLEDLSEILDNRTVRLNECLEITKADESKTDAYVDCDFSVGNIYVQKPTNHLIDYDRTILMIDNCQQNDIELTEKEYAQYVMDNWTWQQDFMVSNAGWSHMACSGALSMGYTN